MQTRISEQYRAVAGIEEAEAVLRNCVHCGFCNATCPTYNLLGDELDGPRGRIYLLKQVVEGERPGRTTMRHLDRCLTCRACETTCPSGVHYTRLLDTGRELVERSVRRPPIQRVMRWLLRKILPYPRRFSLLLGLARSLRWLLPRGLAAQLPAVDGSPGPRTRMPGADGKRKVLLLDGCVQSVVARQTNAAAASVLRKLGVEALSSQDEGCCGAVSYHLSAHDEALSFVRRNIDAWWVLVQQHGIEAIISSASGCGVMLKDYAYLLRHDRDYADKARQLVALVKDLGEFISKLVLQEQRNDLFSGQARNRRLAFHSPCTLQHGQRLNGVVEAILEAAGFVLGHVQDAHLCCGSAGTYSILQHGLSAQLLERKLSALQESVPELIVTANIGCQMHLASRAQVPVRHWIEVVDEVL